MKNSFIVTTNQGLEDIVAEEINELFQIKAYPGIGLVKLEGEFDLIYKVNLKCRTIHKLILLLHETKFKDLNDLYKEVKSIDFSEYIKEDQSFAVRTERIGLHNFTSMDASAIIGKAIIDSYKEIKGIRLKVNLDNPDIEFYCRIKNDEFLIGINTTGESLHKRGYRVYNHPASLKTTLACSMIKISEWKGRENLLDPMCGGGTIPIEAALKARNIPIGIFRKEYKFFNLPLFDKEKFEKILEEYIRNSNKEKYPIEGVDISPKHIKGAIENARSAKVDDTINFIIGDATKLEKVIKNNPERVIVNPPYGIRSSRLEYVKDLYYKFLNCLKRLMDKEGILVVITHRYEEFKKAAIDNNFRIINVWNTKHGNLPSYIFKLKLE